jgi:hypothetical protein
MKRTRPFSAVAIARFANGGSQFVRRPASVRTAKHRTPNRNRCGTMATAMKRVVWFAAAFAVFSIINCQQAGAVSPELLESDLKNQFRKILLSSSAWVTIGALVTLVPAQLVLADAGGKQEVVVSNKKVTFAGAGKKFEITGDNDEITISGECASLQIFGHNNKIVLDAVGSIEVAGDNNVITYRSGIHGGTPSAQSVGHNNQISAAQG